MKKKSSIKLSETTVKVLKNVHGNGKIKSNENLEEKVSTTM